MLGNTCIVVKKNQSQMMRLICKFLSSSVILIRNLVQPLLKNYLAICHIQPDWISSRLDPMIWIYLLKLFQTIDFEQVNEYESVRKYNFVGFANVYLFRCNKKSSTGDNIDVEFYARLIELDTKFGTRSSEQLFRCLLLTTRWNIIKVKIDTRGKLVNIILDYQFQKSPRIWLPKRQKLGWIRQCVLGPLQ